MCLKWCVANLLLYYCTHFSWGKKSRPQVETERRSLRKWPLSSIWCGGHCGVSTHSNPHTPISAFTPGLSVSAFWSCFWHIAITAHYLLISLLSYVWFWPVFWVALVSTNVLQHKRILFLKSRQRKVICWYCLFTKSIDISVWLQDLH